VRWTDKKRKEDLSDDYFNISKATMRGLGGRLGGVSPTAMPWAGSSLVFRTVPIIRAHGTELEKRD